MEEYQDDMPKWLAKFYDYLWWLIKAVAIIAFVAFIIWLRIKFDQWYVNWILK